jgi:hypothetical protein
LRPLSGAVALAGLALTAGLVFTASTVNRDTNQRLLDLQVRQAAAAVGAALPAVQSQLADALQVQLDTGRPAAFRRFVSSKVGPEGQFASVSLWQKAVRGWRPLAEVGEEPRLVANGGSAAFFSRLRPTNVLQVTAILNGRPPRLGYAEMPPGDPDLAVYAESAIPAQRRLVVPKSSPFNDLNFALYLGASQGPADLLESSLPGGAGALRARATVPFGDTELTLVASPSTQLAGGLSAALPWVVLVIGVLVSVLGASTVEYVVRRRLLAERLARENETLYLEQRNIAGTLQQALLPEVPLIEGLQLAARYIPGVAGLDVGGDWYDVISPAGEGASGDRAVFVVGDVSGRGLRAATTMASLRYGTRAYVAEGDRPAVILSKLAGLLDFDTDQHFATVLVGEVALSEHRVTLACAGHFPPLLVAGGDAQFLPVPVHPPIGVAAAGPFTEMSFSLPANGLLVSFTDGLVERRGESLDVSLERMRQAALRTGGPVDAVLDHLAQSLIPAGGADDVVILGLRWDS